MDPLPRKGKESEEDKERESDGRVPLSHLTDNVSLLRPRKSYTLIKTVINKAACCRVGGARDQIKNSFFFEGGWMLLWQFSVMSQFDRVDKRRWSRFSPANQPEELTSCSHRSHTGLIQNETSQISPSRFFISVRLCHLKKKPEETC